MSSRSLCSAIAAAGAAVVMAQSPTPSPSYRPLQADSVLVLRGGAGEGTTLAGAQPLTIVEYGVDGNVRSERAIPAEQQGDNAPCLAAYGTGGYQSDGFIQRSFDQSIVTFPCSNPGVAIGAGFPNNITQRVIGVIYANGTISTSQVVTTAFRDSTTSTLYRTIASVGESGSGYWITGSTSNSDSHGMHYVPKGSSQSTRVVIGNAANQRYVHVGPSWPGSDACVRSPSTCASVPQLYMTIRDPVGQRGVHYVGQGIPTTNQTAGSILLPGFQWYQQSTTNVTTPLIGSFHFEPDGRRIWACDTQVTDYPT